MAIVKGPVWAPLPQTPQAAEYCGMAAVAQLITRIARVYGDCLGVVNLANAPARVQLSPKLLYSGAFRCNMSLPQLSFIESVEWVKAHVLDKMPLELRESMSPLELWKAAGNQVADREAKAALECHPTIPVESMRAVDKDVEMAKISLQVIAAVLRLWPKLPRGMARMPAGTRVGRRSKPVTPDWHVWSEPSRGWVRCSMCWASRLDGSDRAQGSDSATCPGRRPLLDKLGPGHDIWLYSCQADNLAICRSCGFWGTRRIDSLKRRCLHELTEGRRKAIDRVAKGFHPSDSAKLKRVVLDDKGRKHVY